MVDGFKLVCADNANEGFRLIEEEWSTEKQFVMSMDVSKCFDSIQVTLLLDIVNQCLSQPYYRILQYDEYTLQSPVHRKRRSILVPLSCDLFSFLNSYKSHNAALIGGYVTSKLYSRDDIMNTVRFGLTSHLVRVHRQYYSQTRGIPQGSILSVPLCNLYLRFFEKTVLLPGVQSNPLEGLSSTIPHATLIRFVDDFLVITSHRPVLRSFYDYVAVPLTCDCVDAITPAEQVRHPTHGKRTTLSRCSDGEERAFQPPHDVVRVQHRFQASFRLHQLHQIHRVPLGHSLREGGQAPLCLHPALHPARPPVPLARGSTSAVAFVRRQSVLPGVLQRAVCCEACSVDAPSYERKALGAAGAVVQEVRRPEDCGRRTAGSVACGVRVLPAHAELRGVQQGGNEREG